ncbi:MAG: glycoside hydrolase family 127 protein [Lachnospiraceae bacterium]|nr:glycoside hydrolase family 127 protein [Lachnospiraceae bacterium]
MIGKYKLMHQTVMKYQEGEFIKRGKSMAMLLSAAMLVTTLSPLTAEAAEGLTNQVLDLSFDNSLKDPAGAHGVTMGKGTENYAEGIKGQGLSLDGKSYVKLGTEEDLQPENLTLSFWMKPNKDMGNGEQLITWNKNEYFTDGWYLSMENGNRPLTLSVGPAANNGQPYRVSVDGNRAEFFPVGEWTHVAVTYDKETKDIRFYRNGKECATSITYGINETSTGVLGSDASMEKSIGYNGPKYNGSYLDAVIDEYQLFNDVATPEEVIGLYEESGQTFDKEAVAQADLDALKIPSEVQNNIVLPSKGTSGSVITWESSDPDVISKDGKVTRPEIGEENKKVTLTATAAYAGGKEVTKEFEVTVLAKKEVKAEPDSIMGSVTLQDEWLVNAAEKENEYLLSLDSEKFLYEWYKLAGLEPKTDSGYDGWERSSGNNFRGHSFGHYMSATSQAYLSSSGETKEKLKTEISEAVNGLAACQSAYAATHPESAGYVSPFPEEWLQRVDGVPLAGTKIQSGDNLIVPYYNLHKMVAGLLDVAKNVEDQEIKSTALSVAEGFGEYLYNRLSMLTDKNQMLRTEYGGMNEALYELYNLTGNDHFKTAAEYFDETALFEQLAANKDVLNGKHANTTVPKLTGAVKRYTVLTENEEYYNALTQEEKDGLDLYLEAAKNFWDITIDHHTYVTGGNSQSEHFHEADKIGYDATKSEYDASTTCETCNTYNMLKLSKALYHVTGDKKYMDYFERTYTNAILPSQNPETGTTMYFQPMAPGYNKVFNRPFDEFWCCTGTGMENFSKLGDNIYQMNADGVSVNMFWASELERDGIHIKQAANMPNEDTVTFEVKKAKSGTVLRLRKPDWLAGEAVIKVNDKKVELQEEKGYFKVEVKSGDKVSYQMPMEMVAYPMPDKPNLIAFKYGPVVLSAKLTASNMEASNPNGILVRVGTFDPNAQTVITTQNMSTDEWLKNLSKNMVRVEDGKNGEIQFALKNVDSESEELIYSPHYMRYKERYGIYMYMEEPDSQASQDRILANKEVIRNQEMSIDYLDSFDANNSEAAKNQQGENTQVGSHLGKTYRDGQKNGWFSYDMKIDKDAEHNYLNCVFFSGDRGRKFDIMVDGTVLAGPYDYSDAPSGNEFYTYTVEIPKEIIAKAEDGKVTVRFQSKPEYNSYVGGLFGIRTSTSAEYDTEASLKALSFDTGKLTESFAPEKTEYVLEVPMDTESVQMLATPKMESGLVYVGDILIDDKLARKISLTGEETVVLITTKAQDHVTAREYQVTIKKTEEVPEVDKSPLMKKIEEALAMKAEGYTEESYQALQDAIETAQEALNTVETDQDVKDAVAALQEAIDGLKKESGKPDGGDEGDKPDGGGEGSRPDDSNKPGSGEEGNGGKPGTGNSDAENNKNNGTEAGKVKTGDSANPGMMFFLAGSAGAVALIIRKRRA